MCFIKAWTESYFTTCNNTTLEVAQKDGPAQDSSDSIPTALELPQFCAKQLILHFSLINPCIFSLSLTHVFFSSADEVIGTTMFSVVALLVTLFIFIGRVCCGFNLITYKIGGPGRPASNGYTVITDSPHIWHAAACFLPCDVIWHHTCCCL